MGWWKVCKISFYLSLSLSLSLSLTDRPTDRQADRHTHTHTHKLRISKNLPCVAVSHGDPPTCWRPCESCSGFRKRRARRRRFCRVALFKAVVLASTWAMMEKATGKKCEAKHSNRFPGSRRALQCSIAAPPTMISGPDNSLDLVLSFYVEVCQSHFPLKTGVSAPHFKLTLRWKYSLSWEYKWAQGYYNTRRWV